MTLHLHHLTGCTPVPLAYYLKALGVLRLVGEQADNDARGWWQDEHFCLLTKLGRAELEAFFLERYEPTPVFNPWGGRSGFYLEPSEKTARVALKKIEESTTRRLAPYRKAIATVRGVVANHGGRKPAQGLASPMLADLRSRCRGASEAWLGSVIALVGDDYRAPALLGTGGNEGSGSYTSAYLNAVVDCVVERRADHALGLFSGTEGILHGAVPGYSWIGSFGQFMPNGGGSAWDFLLALEGASLFRSTVALRSSAFSGVPARFLSSPFYFAPHAVGGSSLSNVDEFVLNKGRRNPGRGEQWFPIWMAPATLPEIRVTLSEGRCSAKSNQAGRVLDAARAVGSLGVSRGIVAFYRYGYLQRNNQATHFAVPLGRILVQARPTACLVDDISAWLKALQSYAQGSQATARFIGAEHRLDEAVYAALTHDDSPERWQSVLAAAVEVESVQSSGTGFRAGPIPPLGVGWIAAADDESAEWRLACALGSAAGGYDKRGRPRDSVRCHWASLDRGGRRFAQREGRLVRDTRVVAAGRDPVSDLSALVQRRLVEAVADGARRLALVSAHGWEALPGDIADLTSGRVDLMRVAALGRALMAVRWGEAHRRKPAYAACTEWPDEPWCALRLAHLPWSIEDGQAIPVDDCIARRLAAGDTTGAIGVALRRLHVAGLRPPLRTACADPAVARLWLAALAFPVSRATACAMASRFQPHQLKETR